MTASGYTAFSYYLQAVDGYSSNVPCVTKAITTAFGDIVPNCQISSAAAIYGSCMCSKNGVSALSRAASICITLLKCVNGEDKDVTSLYSAFCSSATVLARQIAPVTTDAGVITSSELARASMTGLSTLTSSVASSSTSTSSPISSSGSSGGSTSSSPSLSTGAIVGIAFAGFFFIVFISTFIHRMFQGRATPQNSGMKQEEMEMQELRERALSRERVSNWADDQGQRQWPHPPAPMSTISDGPSPSSAYADGSVHPGYGGFYR